MTDAGSLGAGRRSLAAGWLWAIAAAVGFGLSTPLLQRASAGAGSFASAALLYGGAGLLFAGLVAARGRGARATLPPRRALPLLGVVTVLGAVIAPALLVFGLARTSALAASLLLTAEGAFTVLLAGWWNEERLGARLLVSAALVFAGSAVVVAPDAGGTTVLLGALATLGATLGWAADSTLTARLAGHDARGLVAGKGLAGAAMSTLLALLVGDAWPGPWHAAALVGVGAVGYGASLASYMSAQRVLGAARAAAVFSAGPFVGASFAFALGDRPGSSAFLAGAALIVAGVVLPLRERHGHRHKHAPTGHEHVHSHDDGHHDHVHEPAVQGTHSHFHEHGETEHDHAHAEDEHHRHGHG